jgi:hypothetical protein
MQPIVSRQTSSTRINAILNHPDVLPWVSKDGAPLDLGPIIEHPDVFAIYGEYGGQVYHRLQPGLFEAHSAALPQGRGTWMVEATHQSLKWLFTHTEAVEIVTRVPVGNVAAKGLARAIHGAHDCTLRGAWVKDGQPLDCDIYSLTIQGWMKSSPLLPAEGRRFHDRLEAEFARLGISELAHPDDETHDRVVGAAFSMCLGGQPQKACVFYNRTASLAGWQQISVISLNPLVVDIGSAILVMRGDDFFVPAPKQQVA